MRTATVNRKTAETEISLSLNLDGTGNADIHSGIGFLDHMLTLFAHHGRFDLRLSCKGDLEVDAHHTTEDIGIALGTAFAQALGDKKGICRYGSMLLPMDEALILVAADLSGRAVLRYDLKVTVEKVGTFDTELVKEFWLGFVGHAACALHIRSLDGENAHHMIEGTFKAVGRALRSAVAKDPALADEVPSTKGVL